MYGVWSMVYPSNVRCFRLCGLNKNVDCKSIDDDASLSWCCHPEWISFYHARQCSFSSECLSIFGRRTNCLNCFLFKFNLSSGFVCISLKFVWCAMLESGLVWSGERNFNRRCLSLHIEHDQIVIYIHSQHRTKNQQQATVRVLWASKTLISFRCASVNKWIRHRYERINWMCFVHFLSHSVTLSRTCRFSLCGRKKCGSNIFEHISDMRVGLKIDVYFWQFFICFLFYSFAVMGPCNHRFDGKLKILILSHFL